MFIRLKRDAITIYFTLHWIKSFVTGQYITCADYTARIELLESHISGIVSSMLFRLLRKNYPVTAKLRAADPVAKASIRRFSDLLQKKLLSANCIVLKPYVSPNEKGAILLNYTEVINGFPLLFDMNKIQERYHIVLEPSCESPYQPYFKLYSDKSEVFVQSLSPREIRMDERHGFHAVPLSAGDWIDEQKFAYRGPQATDYDFCMISNFTTLKRHEFVFDALAKYWTGDLKFALIASPYAGNSKEWAESLLQKYGLQGKADIFMQIEQKQIGDILSRSACHVLASLREGANRANFESLYNGTPVVVYAHHIGFPSFRFGTPLIHGYTDAKSLVGAIKKCRTIDKAEVASRTAKMIGSSNASRTLNEEIKSWTTAHGDAWTRDLYPKMNIVHLVYRNPEDAAACADDFAYIWNATYEQGFFGKEYALNRYTGGGHSL